MTGQGGRVAQAPRDALDAAGVREIRVPDIVTVLARHRPDVVLLMAGTNGFCAPRASSVRNGRAERADALPASRRDSR